VAEHRYFADHAAEGPERERLGLIEHLARIIHELVAKATDSRPNGVRLAA
jgi:hypothetical protein